MPKDDDSNTIQVESAADNDSDPVENTPVNPVTVDRILLLLLSLMMLVSHITYFHDGYSKPTRL